MNRRKVLFVIMQKIAIREVIDFQHLQKIAKEIIETFRYKTAINRPSSWFLNYALNYSIHYLRRL